MESIQVLRLKPTQLAVGMHEVTEKVAGIKKLSKKELKAYVKAHPISAVIAPNKEYYIVDGHHHTSAFWQAGVEELHVRVLHDFSKSKLSFKKFWAKMQKNNWCHLFDKYGDGPRHPMYLPHDIRGVSDDPYRSLAWLVRRQNGFEHSLEAFAEFKWANFFRKYKLFDQNFDLDFKKACARGLKLARSKKARGLPGYNGRKG